MKESIYKRMIRDTGLDKFKVKKKKLLSEKIISELTEGMVDTSGSNLKDFLRKNKV